MQCLSVEVRGVATSRERVCFPRVGPTWWRLWENSHAADDDDDDDDGAQPTATEAGTSSRDFLLSRSRRISGGFAKNVSSGRREKILRRQSTSAEMPASIYHRLLARYSAKKVVPHPRDVSRFANNNSERRH